MPRNTLTAEQIVRATIELLDEEGLDGLNMRALGKRLDAAATAMYWHVKNKDNLVRLAGDEVWLEIDLPDLDRTDWRTAAAAMAHDLRAMLVRHPWVCQALAGHLHYGPGKSRHDDHSLAVYESAGFVGVDADHAAATVFTYVLGSALSESATILLTRRLAREGQDPATALRDAVAEASAIAMRFPRLRARVEQASGTGYGQAPDNGFDHGLDTILDGIERRLVSPR
jgi:AcrR family transcriptional regulator